MIGMQKLKSKSLLQLRTFPIGLITSGQYRAMFLLIKVAVTALDRLTHRGL